MKKAPFNKVNYHLIEESEVDELISFIKSQEIICASCNSKKLIATTDGRFKVYDKNTDNIVYGGSNLHTAIKIYNNLK